MTNEIDLNRLFADIARWQPQAFPDADMLSCLYHLVDEITEVDTATHDLYVSLRRWGAGDYLVEQNREALAGELADVLHLCIALAHLCDIHIPTALQKKFEKNQTRTFTYDAERGYAKGD